MAVVKSFKCVRPVKELAKQVASLPYDVYDRKEAKAAVANKLLQITGCTMHF